MLTMCCSLKIFSVEMPTSGEGSSLERPQGWEGGMGGREEGMGGRDGREGRRDEREGRRDGRKG